MSFDRLLLLGVCLSVAGLALVIAPGAALAEPLVCRYLGGDPAAGEPSYECRLDACTTAGSCSVEFYGDGAVCSPPAGLRTAFCAIECGTIFGCDTTVECPARLGSTPVCTQFAVSEGAEPSGICLYPTEAVTYCTTRTEPAVIRHYFDLCHTTPTGDATSNYFLGDCDADGCPNGLDLLPCAVDDGACGAVVRGGDMCAPRLDVDAGTGARDGGALEDAGVMTEDDAGNTEDDAGPITNEDGGGEGLDAGASDLDASVAPPGIAFNGGGGCRCAAPGGGAPVSRGALALVMLGLAIGAARASRARRSTR